MTAFPSYSTGTVAIGSGATTVVGTGSNWTGQNAMPGDLFVVAGNSVIVRDVTDALTLAIDAWPFTAVTAGTAYKLYKVSPLRFAGGQAMADVSTLVAALNTDGFYVFVGPDLSVPDPSYGNDDQYAFQATTGKLWQKTGGTWNFIGTQKGFGTPAPWNSATAYLPFDVASLDGTSYVCSLANTNETPPNATYWTVLAAKGDAATVSVGTVTTGAGGSAAAVTNSGTSGDAIFDFTIPQGEGYSATSTTSLAIGTGSKAFTTQSGLAYANGARVRASSAANTTNWMEGLVTYSGTTLTMTSTKTNGSGTHADWNLNVVGEPGAGDLSSSNNLSDLANAATARTNLGSTTVGDALFTAASAAAARTAIHAPLMGHLFGLTLSTAGSSATFGVDVGQCADSTGADLMALASAFTKTTSAWAVGTAAGALDTGTIAGLAWYHVYLIKRPDTGVVDILISGNASAPTLPANYTLFRRIGSMRCNASSQWVKFVQTGDVFTLSTPIFETGAAITISTAFGTVDISTPIGIKTSALIYVSAQATAAFSLLVSSFDADDTAPAVNGIGLTQQVNSSAVLNAYVEIVTNTLSRIRARSTTTTSVYLTTVGWKDTRGRLG